jgi:hypothetical protein
MNKLCKKVGDFLGLTFIYTIIVLPIIISISNKLKPILRKMIDKLKTINKKVYIGIAIMLVVVGGLSFLVIKDSGAVSKKVKITMLLIKCADDRTAGVEHLEIKDRLKVRKYLKNMSWCEEFHKASPLTFVARYI